MAPRQPDADVVEPQRMALQAGDEFDRLAAHRAKIRSGVALEARHRQRQLFHRSKACASHLAAHYTMIARPTGFCRDSLKEVGDRRVIAVECLEMGSHPASGDAPVVAAVEGRG